MIAASDGDDRRIGEIRNVVVPLGGHLRVAGLDMVAAGWVVVVEEEFVVPVSDCGNGVGAVVGGAVEPDDRRPLQLTR